MKHLHETDLALYACGDLPLWRRPLIGLHLKRCPDCRRDAEYFREERNFVADAATELPRDVNWNDLAGEMRANIQVGLEADECVTPVRRPEPKRGWRAAVALASATLVIVSGWWLLLPHARTAPAQGVVLTATADGIELFDEGHALTLKHTSAEPVVLSVNVNGGMSEHYVDDETGMVTINNVYVQ